MDTQVRDLDRTFNELEKVSETVVKGKFGPLWHRQKNEITSLYPMLERTMVHAKNGINRRLLTRMSKLHPWKVRKSTLTSNASSSFRPRAQRYYNYNNNYYYYYYYYYYDYYYYVKSVDTVLYLITLLLEPPDSLF